MPISNLSNGLRTGVCTSTNRPTTPYEGQHIYETDTDIEYVWSGTAWVVNYVSAASPTFTGTPLAPTATTGTNTTQLATTAFANAAGGLVYITEANPSAVSTVSINNCFSATYNAYRIVWIPTAYSSVIQCQTDMRLRASSSDNSSSNYLRSRWYYGAGGSSGTDGGSATATFWEIGDSNTPFHPFSMDIYSPYQSVRTSYGAKTVSYQGVGPSLYGIENVGTTTVTTAYDGFTLFPANGTFTGKLLVYGYRQA